MAQAKAPAPPKPKPDYKASTPDPEDFAAWCEHPCTRYVAMVWEVAARAQQADWLHQSWTGNNPDPILLARLQARADAYMAFLETGLDDYERTLQTAQG